MNEIKIYSTLSRKKEVFVPLEEGKIGMYLCGPTVYDVPHLGHGRSAVSFDVIRKYFIYRGYEMNFVTNYTDIDDKMIRRAAEEGISVKELSDKVIPTYVEDYGKLCIMAADIEPKATESIEKIIELIQKLGENGYIYELDDGVYFDVMKFEDYGKLSRQKLEELRMGARVAVNENKRNPYDFSLWKLKKEGEPYWESPWGEGRPGWHIECSAMTFKHLGEKFDIHGGGLDLTFPHHECEIAQTEGALGAGTFAKYWMHNGFINMDNEKMSKSLGNFFSLRDIFEKYDPLVVRLMFLQTHYRNPIEFSDKLLDQAKAALARLHDCVRNLRNCEVEADEIPADVFGALELAKGAFEKSMDDDFDSSGALGAVFDLVKFANIMLKDELMSKKSAAKILEFLKSVDVVLGVVICEEELLDEDIQGLIKDRETARGDKDFAKADQIRDDLLAKGIVLEDTAGGTIWKKV